MSVANRPRIEWGSNNGRAIGCRVWLSRHSGKVRGSVWNGFTRAFAAVDPRYISRLPTRTSVAATGPASRQEPWQ